MRVTDLTGKALRYRWTSTLSVGRVLLVWFVDWWLAFTLLYTVVLALKVEPALWWLLPGALVGIAWTAGVWFIRWSHWRLVLDPDALTLVGDGRRRTRIPWGEIVLYEPPLRHWKAAVAHRRPVGMAVIHGRNAEIRCFAFPGWAKVEAAIEAAVKAVDRRLGESP